MKILNSFSGALFSSALLFASLGGASMAQAASMECLISVYTAQDLVTEQTDPMANTQVVSMPIVDDNGDMEIQIHGETVALLLWKYEHTDLYNFTAFLTTPKADLPPRGPNSVAMVSDHLYNDGPTKKNGWDLNPGPNATRFAYLNRQSGAFGLSTKLIAALKAAGKWGTHPFTSSQIDVQSVFPLVDFVKDQISAKTLQPSDVMGLSTVFSCSLQK